MPLPDPVVFQQICNDHKLYSLYLYGSRVYGTDTPTSDYDFIGVGDHDEQTTGIYDITIYSKPTFAKLLGEHEISVLECASQKPLAGVDFTMPQINLAVLRASISRKSSNSYVKAKKKYLAGPDHNPLVGLKSFFHAFRIVDFGIQIAITGQIQDFSRHNFFWRILSQRKPRDWTWDDLDTCFRQDYNTLCSEFVRVAPKAPREKK